VLRAALALHEPAEELLVARPRQDARIAFGQHAGAGVAQRLEEVAHHREDNRQCYEALLTIDNFRDRVALQLVEDDASQEIALAALPAGVQRIEQVVHELPHLLVRPGIRPLIRWYREAIAIRKHITNRIGSRLQEISHASLIQSTNDLRARPQCLIGKTAPAGDTSADRPSARSQSNSANLIRRLRQDQGGQPLARMSNESGTRMR
jgi:hypothetical protein